MMVNGVITDGIIIGGVNYVRAELGIDGNAGYALLGPNIQEGESEFVLIEQSDDELLSHAEMRAAKQALAKLGARLNLGELSYYLGPGLSV
jgi:hypothetical protein